MAQLSCFKTIGRLVGPQTCVQCRLRKVRCDKREGTCSNCERLTLSCRPVEIECERRHNNGAEHSPLQFSGMHRRRLRGLRACTACREKKIKCSGTLPNCTSCKARGRNCTYTDPKRLGRHARTSSLNDNANEAPDYPMSEHPEPCSQSPAESPTSPYASVPAPARTSIMSDQRFSETASVLSGNGTGTRGLAADQLIGFIDVFFRIVYPLPSYAFLHLETTRKRCCDQKNHHSLSFALCAVTVLYTRAVGNVEDVLLAGPDTVSNEQAEAWIQAAEHSIWLHLEHPSISRLQALLLVIHYYMETGRFQRAFMLLATAARFTAAMGLNLERQNLDAVTREVRRRIVWSLKIIERYFSTGLAEFDMLPFEIIYIDLPQSEEQFSGQGPREDCSRDEEECGAYRFLVRLEAVRWDIMRLTRNISMLETPLSTLSELVGHHCQTLANVGAPPTLFQGFEDPESSIAFSNRWLPRRVLAHISWHQAHCDLYRILLRGYPEAAPAQVVEHYDPKELIAAEELCLRHATRIIHILTTLNQHSDRRHLLEFDTAICAYHATRLILFISRYGSGKNRPSPEFAVSRAELCLAALKRFFHCSALVEPIIRELEHRIQVFSRQELQYQKVYNHVLPLAASVRQVPSQPCANLSSHAGCSAIGEGFQAHRPHNTHQEQGPHDPEILSNENQPSSSVQVRQRLAIHSLLRRAEFQEDELDGEGETHVPPNDHGHRLTPRSSDGNYDTANQVTVSIDKAASYMTGRRSREESRSQRREAEEMSSHPSQVGSSHSHAKFTTAEIDHARTPRQGVSSSASDLFRHGAVASTQDMNLVPVPEHVDVTEPRLHPGSMSTFDETGSYVDYPIDNSDIFVDTGAGSTASMEQSIFAWWGSQDWGWLNDADGRACIDR